jgi:hypothetical protein
MLRVRHTVDGGQSITISASWQYFLVRCSQDAVGAGVFAAFPLPKSLAAVSAGCLFD